MWRLKERNYSKELKTNTFCVAAKELGRRYIGCDISEKAIKIANNRLDKITGI